MNPELLAILRYSFKEYDEAYALPLPLKESLNVISGFFKSGTSNKLCLVFPCKEYAAQWLTIPLTIELIRNDFEKNKGDIFESYQEYKKGEKLILNNEAIVEWVSSSPAGATFRTKGTKTSSGADITIKFSEVIMLQRAPSHRRALSSLAKVKETLPVRNISPVDRLLGIDSFSNKQFQKSSICLVGKIKAFEESINGITLNDCEIPEYSIPGRITDNGSVEPDGSKLLITNSFYLLLMHLIESHEVSQIIIDGFNSITPLGDFSDVDRDFKISTILITDLSEIESFQEIKNHGFEFFNFTKQNLKITEANSNSPFVAFETKLNKYITFGIQREICNNAELEFINEKLHSLPRENSDENLNLIKASLIQLSNFFSRISYVPTTNEISNFYERISQIESRFLKSRLWLGESVQLIDPIISALKKFVSVISSCKTEKCVRLEEILKQNYDSVICSTEQEANSLRKYFPSSRMKVISIDEVNNDILSSRKNKAILTGWPNSGNFNRITSSFLFSELTVLFYPFENHYFFSLQKRNRKSSENIRPTITAKGAGSKFDETKHSGFEYLYSGDKLAESSPETLFDIVEFELKIENFQYAKYSGKGNIADSCKAKRIDFTNNSFIYSAESHKFLLINELINSSKPKPNNYSKRVDSLQSGDVIAFINTDRDVLVELVEKTTRPDELLSVKKWTELWKTLLRNYFSSNGNNFKKLVEELRRYDCEKHPVTIKTWLQDDNRIGPDDDADLISIAMLTQSEELSDNIANVRKAISQMTSWRMRASDLVREKIKTKLLEIAKQSIISSPIEIQDLGRVEILKVTEVKKESEEIDKRFVHRLIAKEII